ncbi:uncharacterized protein LOC132061183 [Lycium ferocissimum]|uniref:uncharacterized protein LOC132061183 n=1 Tax=Lycium ferocissimum TaxID=112874 RepID=UPI0028157A08|nr:uncharacterized protein LOC132061183 [Lycium ferocissimum]
MKEVEKTTTAVATSIDNPTLPQSDEQVKQPTETTMGIAEEAQQPPVAAQNAQSWATVVAGTNLQQRISSGLGTPIYADDCTTNITRISFARVLIEMDITKPLPKSMPVQTLMGEVIEQEIAYDWEPQYYEKCLKIGHNCLDKPMPTPHGLSQPQPDPPPKPNPKTHQRHYQRDQKQYQQWRNKGNEQQMVRKPVPQRQTTNQDGWIEVNTKACTAKSPTSGVGDERKVSIGNGFNILQQKDNQPEMGQSSKEAGDYEHRTQDNRAGTTINKITPGWDWITNTTTICRSRIWLIWDPRLVVVTEVTRNPQALMMDVRVALWDHLRDQDNRTNRPWLLMGYYNAILEVDDRVLGFAIPYNEIRDFREFLEDITEAEILGRDYTWTNTHVYSRIDRALVNS